VKHIFVAPKGKLSMQKHKHRAEIWTVVDGSGFVTVGETVHPAVKGNVFRIEKGEIHRAEGGENGMHIIEVQLGDYLGEDDIIRIEDIYGRN
jgi:mannose-6-phosphate isomerase-like protein (cupin superfamily)